jgi:crossover junction endodeoxyribonuclease RuvC
MLGHDGEMLHCEDLPTMNRMGAKAHVKNQINGTAMTDMLRDWFSGYDLNEIHIFLETPIAFPGQSSASLGSSFLTAGIIEGVICARKFRHTLIAPREWKKHLKIGKDKEEARAMAIRLFPTAPLGRKKDHNRAESLLIAQYGHETIT